MESLVLRAFCKVNVKPEALQASLYTMRGLGGVGEVGSGWGLIFKMT